MTGSRAAATGARALALALLAAVALLGWRTPPAHAEDAASCQSSGGVYEYISPGGGGCSHAGGSGMTILRSLTSVNTNATGMICQIGGYPSTCPDPVPANDYWTYWFWSGSSWTYAPVGAASDAPTPGSVRAWTFGNSVTPSWTPPRPATTSPSTTSARAVTTTRATATTAARTAQSSTSTTSTRTVAPVIATSTATPRRSPSRAATAASRPASPSPVHSATPGLATGSPSPTPLAISASPTSSGVGGTPWGALAAAGLVAVAGAGIVVVRRRR